MKNVVAILLAVSAQLCTAGGITVREGDADPKGKMSSVSANDKPFYMIDAREGHIYMSAPFIGGGSGLGWWMLEGRGVWYRPLYWPWKAGTVQRE